ncbi:MAG: phospholipase D-like domain-containing protein [Jatrophihabitans sp.]
MLEYFAPASVSCPTFDADSEWFPIVDGANYFGELDQLLESLAAGDEILVAGFEFDPALDLTGRRPGDHGYRTLLDRLISAGAAGVDVRMLLAGKVCASFVPIPGLTGFRTNAAVCRQVNSARPEGWPTDLPPPLAGHALVDYSGPLLGSNHQKSVVITHGGAVTAFVGGIDLVTDRFDTSSHDTLTLDGERWGWHDMALRLRGPAATRARDLYLLRWDEAATLPPRPYLRPRYPLEPINPPAAPTPSRVATAEPVPTPETAVRVMRSISNCKLDSLLPWRRHSWADMPPSGVREIFDTLTTAIGAARRYVYLEDQYLYDYLLGRSREFEMYPHLRNAAARGVKVILVGSGTRDPEDPGVNLRPINSTVNRDLRRKILNRLDPDRRRNVAIYRVEHTTVHSKVMLIDDVFANIGSANVFSRSMSGMDSEISAAVVTSTSLVRDLRARVWAEHLRTPVTPELTDLDLALGIWDATWLPADRSATMWRVAGEPAGFAPVETALARVDSPG